MWKWRCNKRSISFHIIIPTITMSMRWRERESWNILAAVYIDWSPDERLLMLFFKLDEIMKHKLSLNFKLWEKHNTAMLNQPVNWNKIIQHGSLGASAVDRKICKLSKIDRKVSDFRSVYFFNDEEINFLVQFRMCHVARHKSQSKVSNDIHFQAFNVNNLFLSAFKRNFF